MLVLRYLVIDSAYNESVAFQEGVHKLEDLETWAFASRNTKNNHIKSSSYFTINNRLMIRAISLGKLFPMHPRSLRVGLLEDHSRCKKLSLSHRTLKLFFS